MAIWVADNTFQVRVFDTEKQAWAWLATFSVATQKDSRVWDLYSRGK